MEQYFKIENSKMAVEVKQLGAELRSLYSKETQREYLWQPDPVVWQYQSHVMFPNIAWVSGSRVIIEGREYPLMMHGFVKDMLFTPAIQESGRLLLEVKATADTRRHFPYKFRLQIDHILEDDELRQVYHVVNEDDKPFSFALGTHPGFYCPIVLGERADDYVLHFDTPQTLYKCVCDPTTSLCTDEWELFAENSTDIPLHDHFFDNGAAITKGYTTDIMTLLSKKSGRFMQLKFTGFPYVSLWSIANRLSYICIEPWCGLPDYLETDHVWEHKRGNFSVDAGEAFERVMCYKLG